MKRFLALTGICLCLAACGFTEMPNKMDETTKKIDETNKNMNRTTDKIDETNKAIHETNYAIHLQTLMAAMDQMSNDKNQALIFPLPTGLLAAGKAFAEAATAQELMDITDKWIKEIEQVDPIKGLDKDSAPLTPTDVDLSVMRLQKLAKLYALVVVAGLTPDQTDAQASASDDVPKHDLIGEIVSEQILGYGEYQQTALKFLALRAFCLREVILKGDMAVQADDSTILTTSGMMDKAIRYLDKLEYISRLPFANLVSVHIQEKQYSLLTFDEAQNADGRAATAALWSVALDKAQAGLKSQKLQTWTMDSAQDLKNYNKELNAERADILYMQTRVSAWKR